MPVEGHAVLSPSAAARWGTCTASVAMAETVAPPEQQSEFAAEGARYHGYMEVAAKAGWKLPKELGEEELDVCSRALELLFRMAPRERGWPLQAEQQLPIRHGALDTFGTVDLILTAPDKSSLVIADWKFGRGVPVDAIENKQLALYMLGAWQALGEERHKCKTLSAIIVQPRLALSQGEPAVRWDTDIKEILSVIDPLLKAAGRMRNGIYEYRPSPAACRWCPSKGYCPAAAGMIEQVVEQTDAGEADKIAELPKEKLGPLFKACLLAEQVLDAVKRRVLDLDADGVELPDIKATTGRQGNRAWGSPDEVDALLRGLDPVKYARGDYHAKPKLKSPPQIEKQHPGDWSEVKGFVTRADGQRTVKLHEQSLKEVLNLKRRNAEANRLLAKLDGVEASPKLEPEANPYDVFVNP